MLQVTNLTSGYGGIVAVRSASIKVPLGSMVCLIGANGAGKTTLLNTICGLVAAREGQVRLDGEDVTALPAHLIARRPLNAARLNRVDSSRRSAARALDADQVVAGRRQRTISETGRDRAAAIRATMGS